MLTPLDDYQCHQIVDTIDHLGTSDPNFYERYWFVFGDDRGEVLFVAGLAGYPNRQIIDGMAMVTVEDRRQHNVRLSRDASRDRDRGQTWVGPLHVEVLEGLKRLRVVMEPSDHPFSFDITFEARQSPFERPMDVARHRSRIVNHTCHLNQMGTATGHAIAEGNKIVVDPAHWYGLRDRSWGLRPGDPAIVPKPAPDQAAWKETESTGAFWQWIATQWSDHYTYWHRFDMGDRVTRGLWGDVIYPGVEPVKITRAEFTHIEYQALFGDLRRFRSGEFVLEDANGNRRDVRARHLIMNSLRGGGYGSYKGFHHGAWMGETFEDGESWDLTREEDQRELEWNLAHEHWCEFESEGARGIGMMEISDGAGCRWFETFAPDRLVVS